MCCVQTPGIPVNKVRLPPPFLKRTKQHSITQYDYVEAFSRDGLSVSISTTHVIVTIALLQQSLHQFVRQPSSACPTNRTIHVPQSHDSSYYVSRPILAPPQLLLQKLGELHATDYDCCIDLLRHPVLVNVTCARRWRLCGINPATKDVRALAQRFVSCAKMA